LKVLQTTNLGKSLGGSTSDIRYSIYNTLGVQSGSTTNTGIYEIGSSTGLFGVQLDVSTSFSGSIVWSVNGNTSVYAVEEVKIDQKLTRIIQTGRWKIDKDDKQLIFYDADNDTELIKYNLFDRKGAASIDEVFDRVIAT